jgi:hypothetical protein
MHFVLTDVFAVALRGSAAQLGYHKTPSHQSYQEFESWEIDSMILYSDIKEIRESFFGTLIFSNIRGWEVLSEQLGYKKSTKIESAEQVVQSTFSSFSSHQSLSHSYYN